MPSNWQFSLKTHPSSLAGQIFAGPWTRASHLTYLWSKAILCGAFLLFFPFHFLSSFLSFSSSFTPVRSHFRCSILLDMMKWPLSTGGRRGWPFSLFSLAAMAPISPSSWPWPLELSWPCGQISELMAMATLTLSMGRGCFFSSHSRP